MFVWLSCLYAESKDGSKRKGRRGAKNSATAAKVALMKLKLHASGDKGLPQVKCKIMAHTDITPHILSTMNNLPVHVYNLVLLYTLTVLSFPSFLPCRQNEPTFRCIFPKNLKVPANRCSFAPNGVLAKWWIMQLL